MTSRSSDDGELTVRGRKPFAMIPTDLVRDPDIGSSAIRLWTVLASYAFGSDVVTRPSRVALAKDCGYGSTRAVDLNLRQLQRVGWLTIEPTRRADGGRGNNRYILEWEPRASAPPPTPEDRDPSAVMARRIFQLGIDEWREDLVNAGVPLARWTSDADLTGVLGALNRLHRTVRVAR